MEYCLSGGQITCADIEIIDVANITHVIGSYLLQDRSIKGGANKLTDGSTKVRPDWNAFGLVALPNSNGPI